MEHKTLSFRNQEAESKLQSPLPERLHHKRIIKTKNSPHTKGVFLLIFSKSKMNLNLDIKILLLLLELI